MNNIKKLTAAFMAVLLLFSLAACGDKTDSETTEEYLTETASSYIRDEKTKIAALDGPVGFGVTKFSVDRAYNYETEFLTDATEIINRLKAGTADIATLPVDAAANLYNETNGAIKLLAVNGLGFYHVLEKGETVKSISDLKGKTVYAAYQGTNFEKVINYTLAQNGIDPEKDINIQFKATDKDVAGLTASEADICILPEPYASKVLNNEKNFRAALDLNDEWDKISETPLAQSVVVARAEYIDANPDIIKEFIGFNKISVNYLITNTYGAPVFLKDNGFCETVVLATAVIPGCNLCFIDGADMKTAVSAVLSNVHQITVDDGFWYGI